MTAAATYSDNNYLCQSPSPEPADIGPLVRIKAPFIDWATFGLMKTIGLTPTESLLFLRVLTGAKQRDGRWYVEFGTTQASQRSGVSRHRAIDLKKKLQASGAALRSRPGVKGRYVDEWDITPIMRLEA